MSIRAVLMIIRVVVMATRAIVATIGAILCARIAGWGLLQDNS